LKEPEPPAGFGANPWVAKAGPTAIANNTTIMATTLNNTRMRFILAPPPSTEGGVISPATSADAITLTSGDEFLMNFVPFSALFLANFGEFLFHALR